VQELVTRRISWQLDVEALHDERGERDRDSNRHNQPAKHIRWTSQRRARTILQPEETNGTGGNQKSEDEKRPGIEVQPKDWRAVTRIRRTICNEICLIEAAAPTNDARIVIPNARP
jgi:hypothetical protein